MLYQIHFFGQFLGFLFFALMGITSFLLSDFGVECKLFSHREVFHVHLVHDVHAQLLWAGGPRHDARLHAAEVELLLALDAEHVHKHCGGAVD